MADVTLTVQELARSGSGITPSYTAMNATDQYLAANDGRVMLHCKNTNAGAGTLTVVSQGTIDGLAVTDLTATIPANTGDKMLGPFPPGVYNNASGQLAVTASLATGMTVAAIRMP